MFDFFALLTFFVGIVPVVANSMAIADTEVVANENLSSTHKIKITELEKQEGTILSLAEFKDELYIGMMQNYLAKINSDGKITQISLENEGKIGKNIISMKELNGSLYWINRYELFEMNSNDEIRKIFKYGEALQFLEIFKGELYFTLTLENGYNSLMKRDSNGNFSKILDFSIKCNILDLKTINNHLYIIYAFDDGIEISEINTTNGEIKKVALMENKWFGLLGRLIGFNNELYVCLDDGSLFKINTNGEVKEVVKRNISFGSEIFAVFRNELYLVNSNKLEKLTEDNKIETVVEVVREITALTTFNDELYIGMFDGYFAKLS